MLERLSDLIEVRPEDLERADVLNTFVKIDSQFYVDPFLLKSTEVPEFKGSYKRIQKRFEKVISFLLTASSKSTEDRCYREAVKFLQFKECKYISLGHCTTSSNGRGIGAARAEKIAGSAFDIVHAGVKSPSIFELIGLFEDGIAGDLISDMTISIILIDILNFTQRISSDLSAKTCSFHFGNRPESWRLPFIVLESNSNRKKEPRLLLPKSLLRKLPVFQDWSSLSDIQVQNQNARDRANRVISSSFGKALEDLSTKKSDLQRYILDDVTLLSDLIEVYNAREESSYDFESDPLGEFVWYENAEKYTQISPLYPSIEIPEVFNNVDDAESIIVRICSKFASLLDDNALSHTLWVQDERTRKPKLRNERYAQLLFFAVADSYCDAHNLDISREPNAGRGPVDFKFSRGRDIIINVEIKYTSNSRLLHGYESQLAQYNRSERANSSIYVVIRVSQDTDQIHKLMSLQNRKIASGQKSPKIIIADGYVKPSASKATNSSSSLLEKEE